MNIFNIGKKNNDKSLFEDLMDIARAEKNNDTMTELFGVDAKKREFVINEILDNDEFYDRMVKDTGIKDLRKVGNTQFIYLFKEIDKEFGSTTVNEKLSLAILIYANTTGFIEKIRDAINRLTGKKAFSPKDALMDFLKSKMKKQDEKKEPEYTYKIENSILVIRDKGDIIEEGDFGKILTSILEKEKYEKISKLKVFYYSSQEKAFEIITEYANEELNQYKLSEL
jgi:hypothetical protein